MKIIDSGSEVQQAVESSLSLASGGQFEFSSGKVLYLVEVGVHSVMVYDTSTPHFISDQTTILPSLSELGARPSWIHAILSLTSSATRRQTETPDPDTS